MIRRAGVGLAGVLLGLVMAAAVAPPAHAHALLLSSDPADGVRLDSSPDAVVLGFSEVPDVALATIRLLDSSGTELEVQDFQLDPGDSRRLRLPLDELARGAYTVRWRVTSSSDGHTTAGAVAFGVEVGAVPASRGSTSLVSEAPAPAAEAVAGRWLFYAGVTVMLGAAVVGLFVTTRPGELARWPLVVAWSSAALGTAMTIDDQRRSSGASLSALLASDTGQKLTTQALAVAVAGLAVAWARRGPSRRALVATGVAAAGAMLARALAGHASASATPWFTVTTQWGHMVAVGAWIGGLFWLLLAMGTDEAGRRGGLLRRFSGVATATVGAIALTGVLRAIDQVGAWDRLWETSFGQVLLAKVALFAALVVLGSRSRRHARGTHPGSRTAPRRLVRAEVGLGVAALVATAFLTNLPPSSSVAAASGSAGAGAAGGGSGAGADRIPAECTFGFPDESYSVRLSTEPDPPRAEGAEFALDIERAGEAVVGARVCLEADMTEHQHPGVQTQAVEVAPGRYLADLEFSMTGTWRGAVIIVVPDAKPVAVPVAFDVR